MGHPVVDIQYTVHPCTILRLKSPSLIFLNPPPDKKIYFLILKGVGISLHCTYFLRMGLNIGMVSSTDTFSTPTGEINLNYLAVGGSTEVNELEVPYLISLIFQKYKYD